MTLENVPSHGVIHFNYNSWVYPAHKYKMDHIFFSNKVNQQSTNAMQGFYKVSFSLRYCELLVTCLITTNVLHACIPSKLNARVIS